MNIEVLIKGAVAAIIGGLIVKGVMEKSKRAALEAEYKELGCEEVEEVGE